MIAVPSARTPMEPSSINRRLRCPTPARQPSRRVRLPINVAGQWCRGSWRSLPARGTFAPQSVTLWGRTRVPPKRKSAGSPRRYFNFPSPNALLPFRTAAFPAGSIKISAQKLGYVETAYIREYSTVERVSGESTILGMVRSIFFSVGLVLAAVAGWAHHSHVVHPHPAEQQPYSAPTNYVYSRFA